MKNRNELLGFLREMRATKEIKDESVVSVTIDNVPLSVNTKSKSRFDLLYDALAPLKTAIESMEVIGNKTTTVCITDVLNMHNKADDVVKTVSKGKRNGYLIQWTLEDGTYTYDIFKDKLMKEDYA